MRTLAKRKKNDFLDICSEVYIDSVAEGGFWVVQEDGSMFALQPYAPWMDEVFHWIPDVREAFRAVADHPLVTGWFLRIYTPHEGEQGIVEGFINATAGVIRETLRAALQRQEANPLYFEVCYFDEATPRTMQAFMDAAARLFSKLSEGRKSSVDPDQFNLLAVEVFNKLDERWNVRKLADKLLVDFSVVYAIREGEGCTDSSRIQIETRFTAILGRPIILKP